MKNDSILVKIHEHQRLPRLFVICTLVSSATHVYIVVLLAHFAAIHLHVIVQSRMLTVELWELATSLICRYDVFEYSSFRGSLVHPVRKVDI